MKPTQILAKLCKEAKLDPPAYMNGTVRVGAKTFRLQNNTDDAVEWYCAKGAVVAAANRPTRLSRLT